MKKGWRTPFSFKITPRRARRTGPQALFVGSLAKKLGFSAKGKPILPMTELEAFLQEQHVRVGVVTVGEDSAQEVCDRLVQGGVEAIWSFAPGRVELPQGVMLKQENLALSLAHLKMQLD